MNGSSRRRFVQNGLALAGLGLLAGCGITLPQAQQRARVPRLGYLALSAGIFAGEFHQGLRELGYVEGQNILIEWRFAEGREERLPELAAELVRLQVDVIVTQGVEEAARQATSTIPIVMATSADPVATGAVASLAHPGGNVTGLTAAGPELGPKRLELLKEALPGVSRVAVLWDSSDRGKAVEMRGIEAAARTLGVQVQSLEVRGPDDFEAAFEAATDGRAEALMPLRSPLIAFQRSRIVDLAAMNRLPAMYSGREFVDAGDLMSYGPNQTDSFRRAATYVDKILKGAKPADLPVERPTKFELVINLKTTQALGPFPSPSSSRRPMSSSDGPEPPPVPAEQSPVAGLAPLAGCRVSSLIINTSAPLRPLRLCGELPSGWRHAARREGTQDTQDTQDFTLGGLSIFANGRGVWRRR